MTIPVHTRYTNQDMTRQLWSLVYNEVFYQEQFSLVLLQSIGLKKAKTYVIVSENKVGMNNVGTDLIRSNKNDKDTGTTTHSQ